MSSRSLLISLGVVTSLPSTPRLQLPPYSLASDSSPNKPRAISSRGRSFTPTRSNSISLQYFTTLVLWRPSSSRVALTLSKPTLAVMMSVAVLSLTIIMRLSRSLKLTLRPSESSFSTPEPGTLSCSVSTTCWSGLRAPRSACL